MPCMVFSPRPEMAAPVPPPVEWSELSVSWDVLRELPMRNFSLNGAIPERSIWRRHTHRAQINQFVEFGVGLGCGGGFFIFLFQRMQRNERKYTFAFYVLLLFTHTRARYWVTQSPRIFSLDISRSCKKVERRETNKHKCLKYIFSWTKTENERKKEHNMKSILCKTMHYERRRERKREWARGDECVMMRVMVVVVFLWCGLFMLHTIHEDVEICVIYDEIIKPQRA